MGGAFVTTLVRLTFPILAVTVPLAGRLLPVMVMLPPGTTGLGETAVIRGLPLAEELTRAWNAEGNLSPGRPYVPET
jgi:hypothetical protein